MQARAIFRRPHRRQGGEAPFRSDDPAVATAANWNCFKAVVDKVAGEVFAEKGRTLHYQVGTMIELHALR